MPLLSVHAHLALLSATGFELLGGIVGVGVCIGSILVIVWARQGRRRNDSPVRPDQR